MWTRISLDTHSVTHRVALASRPVDEVDAALPSDNEYGDYSYQVVVARQTFSKIRYPSLPDLK